MVYQRLRWIIAYETYRNFARYKLSGSLFVCQHVQKVNTFLVTRVSTKLLTHHGFYAQLMAVGGEQKVAFMHKAACSQHRLANTFYLLADVIVFSFPTHWIDRPTR